MRLLERKVDGDFSLTEFIGDSIPRYAILSHTWGADDEEVTYKDLIKATYRMKPGYEKIRFCVNQAVKDDLFYFWVDTCCIDKSSSAELSEAINSMFAWYRNATRCYVFLSDVPAGSLINGIPSQQSWTVPFQQSRWFTRGWTLQELIAPASVEFFSVEGQRLGDKESMVQELHSITGISVKALLQSPLHELSVEERMSWIGQRNTKREEDAAYSLLGIFDVHMPLIYGEGRKKAFARLQKEINALSIEEGLEEQSQATFGRKRTREPFSTVPFAPDADFVDRPEILPWVSNKCAGPGARAALVGLGGVGYVDIRLACIQYTITALC
jgi:hypothetical protein